MHRTAADFQDRHLVPRGNQRVVFFLVAPSPFAECSDWLLFTYSQSKNLYISSEVSFFLNPLLNPVLPIILSFALMKGLCSKRQLLSPSQRLYYPHQHSVDTPVCLPPHQRSYLVLLRAGITWFTSSYTPGCVCVGEGGGGGGGCWRHKCNNKAFTRPL